MPTSPRVRLALLLACALLPVAAQAQSGRPAPVKQPKESPRQADALSAAARREWDERRDWIHFTTGVLGDTAVTDSMKALLASGLDPDTQDKYGRTALHAAALLGQLDLARYLLSKGADVNTRDGDGRTPLMISASAGGFDPFPGMATVSPWGLIWTEPVCDLDRQEERSSPVVRGLDTWHDMVVAERPMLRLLLEAGADLSLKDSKGGDALDHAAMGGPSGLDRLLPMKTATGEQSRCDLNLARTPEVRGLRLGMTLREATSRFKPSSSLPDAEWCGRQTLEFDWSDDLLGQPAPRPRELAGVRRIMLGFLDGRLAYFRVTYDGRDAPLTHEQFRSTLSSGLALPGRWRRASAAGEFESLYSVSCEGFVIVAGYNAGPYVELHDTPAATAEGRREAAEAARGRGGEGAQEKGLQAMSAAGEMGEGMKGATSPLALHLLGILRAHEGRYEEAEDAFLRAVGADPEMAGSYMELGLVYACRGEYPQMVGALRQAVEAGSGGVRAYLGNQPLGDVAGAPKPGSYGHTQRGGKDKSDIVTPLVAAMSYLAEGRDEEAARMLEQALGDEPASAPPAVALLTLTYLLRGESVEADEAGIRRAAAAAGGRARRC